MSTEFLLLRHL